MLGALFPADMPLAARFFIVGLLLLIIIIAVDIVLLLLSRRRIHASHWHGESVSTEQLAVIEQRIANENKSTALAYVLWLVTGTLGIHNFYIGRWIRGLVEFIVGFAGLISLIVFWLTGLSVPVLFGYLFISVVGVLLLIDLFIIPIGIRDYRTRLRAQYIAELAMDAPPDEDRSDSKGGQVGPLTLKELRQTLTTFSTPHAHDVLVWHQGLLDWKPAKEVVELIPARTPTPPPLPSGS
jgi:hypothetical protein